MSTGHTSGVQVSRSAKACEEGHQPVSITSTANRPPDHVSPQGNIAEPSTEPKANIRKRRWDRNLVAILKDLWRRHKRKTPLRRRPSVCESIIAIFKTSWLNVLLIFVPISWALYYVKLDDTSVEVFVCSFLGVIPLAKLLDFATEDLSLRLGPTLAELLNTTLGNGVDFIVAIIALVKCQLDVARSFLVGSILRNLLLVLGTCFYVGGTRFSEQGFNYSAIKLDSSLLSLSVIAVMLPGAFHGEVQPVDGTDPLTNRQEGYDILSTSHGVSVILLFIYLCYIVFQLFSHSNLYDDHQSDVQQSPAYPSKFADKLHISQPTTPSVSHSSPPTDGVMDRYQMDARSLEAGLEEEEIKEPEMGRMTAIVVLIIVAVLVSITAGFLVDSIDGLTSSGRISRWFVGLILLPNVGNAADNIFVIVRSAKRSSKASLGAPVGSSIQIALFIFPLIIIVGWVLGRPLTLLFDRFESIVLCLSVLTVGHVVQGGTSNWLKGMILICLYLIIAVTFWYYPGAIVLCLFCLGIHDLYIPQLRPELLYH